jgi:uncharacterized protein YaiE (UPF0345 family)
VAIDDLPLPVVNLLNALGVPWPYIDEDQVQSFATLTRQFATAVRTTHEDATRTIADLAAAYQGSTTEAMSSGWAKLSGRHVDEIIDGSHVLADALDVAAGYIVAQKAEAIAVLVGMAAAFVGDQVAAVATFGIAEVAVPVIIEGAERIVKSLVMDLEQYVAGEVIEAAAEPLFGKIEEAFSGLDWSRSGAGVEPARSVSLDAQTALAHIAKLEEHAETMHGHGTQFRTAVAGLGF